MKLIVIVVLLIIFCGCSKDLVRYHGHKYHIIEAGQQYWMDENLSSKSYRFGRKIPFITDYNVWPELQSPGCGYYNNDTSKQKKYGMLYNWYAVDNGKLCPVGWRVPTNNDWLKLEEQLGGYDIAGGKMKAISGWYGNHVSGDDIGFKALPGGYRLNADFLERKVGIWWTSTSSGKSDFQNDSLYKAYTDLFKNSGYVWGRKIEYSNSQLINTLNLPNNGFSVRCIRVRQGRKTD
jgi:uncharacterized protein (TIGR02145 family)